MDTIELVERFNPDNAIAGVINRVAAFIRVKIIKILRTKQVDLTSEEFAIMVRLWGENGISQSELTEMTFKDKTNVSKLIERLAGKELIAKKNSEMDQRNHIVFLTEKGNRLKYVVLPEIIRLIDGMSKDIPTADLEATIRTLRSIYRNLHTIE